MALPNDRDLQIALLSAIQDAGGEARPRDIYPEVTARFPGLTTEDLVGTLPSGANRWTNRIQWQRQKLVVRGEIAREPRGIWRITDKGRDRLKLEPPGSQPKPPKPARAPELPAGEADEGKPHREVQNHLQEIGEMLGYRARVEDRLYDRQYDVTWRRDEYSLPSSIFEVQHGGSLDSARDKLRHAHDNCRARVCLVVTSERDHEKAKQGLGPIQLLRAEEIARLHQTLARNRDVLRRLV